MKRGGLHTSLGDAYVVTYGHIELKLPLEVGSSKFVSRTHPHRKEGRIRPLSTISPRVREISGKLSVALSLRPSHAIRMAIPTATYVLESAVIAQVREP